MYAKELFKKLVLVCAGVFVLTFLFFSMQSEFDAVMFAVSVGALVLFAATVAIIDVLTKKIEITYLISLVCGIVLGGVVGKFLAHLLTLPSVHFISKASYLAPIEAMIYLASIYFSINIFHLIFTNFSGLLTPISSGNRESKGEVAKNHGEGVGTKIYLDETVFFDVRLPEFLATGIFGETIYVPAAVIQMFKQQSQRQEVHVKNRAQRALNVFSKIDTLPNIKVELVDGALQADQKIFDFVLNLAKEGQGALLTADHSITFREHHDVRIVNLHLVANTLRPLTQMGETIEVKVQRYGKEPLQGVGYLEDGSMVVINGGAEYIGESVKAKVLSIKHTTSGRMVFCNALEEIIDEDDGGGDGQHGQYESSDEDDALQDDESFVYDVNPQAKRYFNNF